MNAPELPGKRELPLLLVTLVSSAIAWDPAYAYNISSYAFVQEDGSLRIRGRTIHLYGISIPNTNQSCRVNQIPPSCGSRASVALEFKINGFVHCEIKSRKRDQSLIGLCRVDRDAFFEGEDLSAYLLNRGWAVALPDAPFEYHTLERIARSRGLGLWGIPIDTNIRDRDP